MSRIGKLPINIPTGTSVIINDNVVTVKGKLGELKQGFDPMINVVVEGNNVVLSRNEESKEAASKWGLYRALVANMIKGVSDGFTTTLELVGVGYKASSQGQILELSLGYSHSIHFDLCPEIKVETINEKGKNPTIIITSHDRQLLGQVAAKIRSYRMPEPYKGKGILFKGEVIRRKAGKAAGK